MKERVFITPAFDRARSANQLPTSVEIGKITSTFQLMKESFGEPSASTENIEDLVIDEDFEYHLPDDELNDLLVDEIDFLVNDYEWFVRSEGQRIGFIRGSMADNLEDLDKPHQWIVGVLMEPNFTEYFSKHMTNMAPAKHPDDLLQDNPDLYWKLLKDFHDDWKNLWTSRFQSRNISLTTHIKAKIRGMGDIKLEVFDANKNLF